MAVAELLVSLGQSSQGNEHSQNGHQPTTDSGAGSSPQTSSYRAKADYVGLVNKAYESNPRVYTEFLSALEKYHEMSLTIEQLVRIVMALFQDQPDLLMGFKDFLPEAQGLLNQLVPPMMYSDYKVKAKAQATIPTGLLPSLVGVEPHSQEQIANNDPSTNGHAAADFLSLIKERSQQEPNMYQHLITLLRKFQKDHSYATLYFYVSIILRHHPHLLQRFHKFLPTVATEVEVTEPRVISKAPPEELVISPDFIEAKDFVQTVKYESKNDVSMYDRFISALEKYQCNGWTIDQVYSEVSLIFWNHPEALAGFKQFITTVPQQP
ncbi:Paired amphipathic helix protein Sin3b [Linnemannia zychae]|nr:Paired amphipathic helix protein Sin3b [Linnemannia zychae]